MMILLKFNFAMLTFFVDEERVRERGGTSLLSKWVYLAILN